MQPFDWKNPDYYPIIVERERRLRALREDPGLLREVKHYYKENIGQFITDWGVTVDPRNPERGIPAVTPFILFPKQEEWVTWVINMWRGKAKRGLTEKSREMGVSWLAVCTASSLCLFYEGLNIGFGSRKQEYVDKLGAPKCLFYKARMFIQHLPPEFRGSWNVKRDAPEMLIKFPDTGSTITGESGDSIGRGDRTSIYFVDEAAHLEHPDLTDAALSNTTNCRIDMSSVAGTANPFAQARFSGKISVFTFHWRDDPRKDDAWYAQMCADYPPEIIAQEVDINYNASVSGVIIPAEWVNAAVDAHIKLGIKPTGERHSALDVADEGKDKNAQGFRHGVVLTHAESWSGKGSDIYGTVERTFDNCDLYDTRSFDYDADGLGAGVKGDARKINEERTKAKRRTLVVNPFRGSGGVLRPDEKVRSPDGTPLDRTNADMFKNRKAQGWWALRFRFQQTFRALKGMSYDPDEIISISSAIPEKARLIMELSQPVWDKDGSGKILVDKQPDGVPSPNLADMVMMLFAPRNRGMHISAEALGELANSR